MRGVGKWGGESGVVPGVSPARPGWESDPSFLPRVQCLALGLAEGTELYRPLRESRKVGGLRTKREGKTRARCCSDPLPS